MKHLYIAFMWCFICAIICFFLFLISSCAPQLYPVAHPRSSADAKWTTEDCSNLMFQRDIFVWTTAFSGALGGVGGLSTAFPEDDRKDVRLGLGITSAVFAAISTSSALIARSKSMEFENSCNRTIEEPAAPVVPAYEETTVTAYTVDYESSLLFYDAENDAGVDSGI